MPNSEIHFSLKIDDKPFFITSHKSNPIDIISQTKTKLIIYLKENGEDGKLIFKRDLNNDYIICFVGNHHGMNNWNLYYDGKEIMLSKEYFSLFKIFHIKGKDKSYYIKEKKFGRYIYNSKLIRDSSCFYLGVADIINENEKEKYTFYYK